ncbi:Probable inactive leucine-rich repeat receptor kinase XIAO [Linum perenne]
MDRLLDRSKGEEDMDRRSENDEGYGSDVDLVAHLLLTVVAAYEIQDLTAFKLTLHDSFAVYLQYNSLSNDLPPSVFNLTNLEVFSGFIFSLYFLDLSSISFLRELPSNFSSENSQFQLVNLSFNNFSGEVPARIGHLQGLQYLWLDSNRLYDGVSNAEVEDGVSKAGVKDINLEGEREGANIDEGERK